VEAGFNVFGAISAPSYDDLVTASWRCAALCPDARSVVIVGSGGPALFEAFAVSPEAALSDDPLDAYTRRVIETEAPKLGAPNRAAFPFDRSGEGYADFVSLGRAAGLGAPSRLGMILHPVFGPWFALRAALLLPVELTSPALSVGFDPCRGCLAPCAAICPAGAPTPDGFDRASCAAARARTPGCRLRCDARRACVIGPDHAYSTAAEAHHMAQIPLLDIASDGTC
jgi:epoxyqueuosine reductase QueG